jgi:hypothetical protein
MDSPIDASTARQSAIGSIHDSIHTHARDVACQQPHARAMPTRLAVRSRLHASRSTHRASLSQSGRVGKASGMRRPVLSVPPTVPRVLLLALSLLGWGLALLVIIITVRATIEARGEPVTMGTDVYTYWIAGRHLLEGESLYRAVSIIGLDAYRYPPPFAQAWAPLALLPALLADWVWRILGLLSIRYMAGSWQVTGVWFLFPGTITELSAGNVTFQMAALTVAGLRGRAEGIFPAAIVKFSTAVVVPFLWVRRPEARRGLLVGALIAVAIVATSFLADPGRWSEYVDHLRSQGGFSLSGTAIVYILPSASADFLLRLVIAATIVIAAIRFDSPHLAFVASFLATPTIWAQRTAILIALLTLENDRWLRPHLWPWRPRGRSLETGRAPTGPESPGVETVGAP